MAGRHSQSLRLWWELFLMGSKRLAYLYAKRVSGWKTPMCALWMCSLGACNIVPVTADGEGGRGDFNNYRRWDASIPVNLRGCQADWVFCSKQYPDCQIIPGRPIVRSCLRLLNDRWARLRLRGLIATGNLGNGTSANQYTPIRLRGIGQ